MNPFILQLLQHLQGMRGGFGQGMPQQGMQSPMAHMMGGPAMRQMPVQNMGGVGNPMLHGLMGGMNGGGLGGFGGGGWSGGAGGAGQGVGQSFGHSMGLGNAGGGGMGQPGMMMPRQM